MKEAINSYDAITATSEFRELERLRDRTRHNEASANYSEQKGEARERAKWQTVVASKDAAFAEKIKAPNPFLTCRRQGH